LEKATQTVARLYWKTSLNTHAATPAMERSEGAAVSGVLAGDHVGGIAQVVLQQASRALGRIAAVAVHHDDHVVLEAGERRRDRAPLAATGLEPDLGPCRSRDRRRRVRRSVVDHQDPCVREGGAEIADHARDAVLLVQTRDEDGQTRAHAGSGTHGESLWCHKAFNPYEACQDWRLTPERTV
jgi:hypothetical protein